MILYKESPKEYTENCWDLEKVHQCCRIQDQYTKINFISTQLQWEIVTESKLILLAAGQVSELIDELLGQRIVTLFGKSVDQKDGGLVSLRTILPKSEFGLPLY